MTKIFLSITLLTLVACNPTPGNQTTQTANPHADSIATQTASIDDSIKFDLYCNARFAYCIEYPGAILYPQAESQNGDGRVFKNKQGEEVLTVFGRMNADPDGGAISLEQQYNDDLHGAPEENGNKDRVITYQKLGKTFFVISGYKKGKIFYQKTILKEGAFAYAILEYPESEKEIFDKVSTRLFRSFK